MKLYHYSKARYPFLATLNHQQGNSSTDIREYGNSISFFLEPIPRNIATLLHGEHAFWKGSEKLYEYVVDTDDLPPDFPYTITETPEKIYIL